MLLGLRTVLLQEIEKDEFERLAENIPPNKSPFRGGFQLKFVQLVNS